MWGMPSLNTMSFRQTLVPRFGNSLLFYTLSCVCKHTGQQRGVSMSFYGVIMDLISSEDSMCIKADGGDMCHDVGKQKISVVLCTITLS